MIIPGDIFIVKLESDYYGAIKVLSSGPLPTSSPFRGYYGEDEAFYLIMLTKYYAQEKPQLTDPRLSAPYRQAYDIAHINYYRTASSVKLDQLFQHLGNCPPTKEELELAGDASIGEGITADFGLEAFLTLASKEEIEIWQFINGITTPPPQQRILSQQYPATRKPSTPITGEVLCYKDDKSDKFWRIEYAGNELAINYGKTGTAGKYQVKEFADNETCEKEAKKLVASKIKKGYAPYTDFDPASHLYFDDDEIGLHILTSHPIYRANFPHDLYYDCADEEAPFGSDEGSDTLYFVEKAIRKDKSLDFSALPMHIVENEWGMRYLPAEDTSPEGVKALLETEEGIMDQTNSDMVTYAVAFAQIKITGKLDTKLKDAALAAMKRMEISSEIQGYCPPGQPSEILTKMMDDLIAFKCCVCLANSDFQKSQPLSFNEAEVLVALKSHLFSYFTESGLNPYNTTDWKKGIFQLFGVQTVNMPDLDKESYILASNHISDFDAIILGLLHPKIRILSKIGWATNEELIGFLKLHYDIVGIYRNHELEALPAPERKAAKEHNFSQLRAINRYLKDTEQPQHLLIFPQGTISDINKNSVERVNPGFAKMAHANKVQVINIFIEYPRLGDTLRVIFGSPYQVSGRTNSNNVCDHTSVPAVDYRQRWLEDVIGLQHALGDIREPILSEKHMNNNAPGELHFG